MVASIIFPALIPAGVSGYTIETALMLDGSADFLTYTPGTPQLSTSYTISFWMKRTELGTEQYFFSTAATDGDNGNTPEWLRSNNSSKNGAGDHLHYTIQDYGGGSTSTQKDLVTSGVFRDPTAWTHVHLMRSGSTWTLSINGATASLGTDSGSLTTTGKFFGNYAHYIGSKAHSTPADFAGVYLAEYIGISGTALAVTNFGEYNSTTGIWVPKDSSEITSFGNAGFYLKFNETGTAANADGIGADSSGNNNHFAVTSLEAANITTDSCTDDADNIGNYATLNPIASSNRKGGLSNGNLRASGVSKDNFSTMNIPLSGKWYFEGTLTAVAGTGKDAIGVVEAKSDQIGAYATTITVLYAKSGEKFLGSSWETYPSSGGTTYVAGDIIGVYIDDGQVTFYKNNASQGTCGSAFTTQCFATTQNANAATVWDLNFGQKGFTYTPPTGAKALNSANLTSGYTGSLSDSIVTTNATEANIKSTTEGAHSFSNWISFLYNRDASEQRIFYASDDSSNYIPFADDGVLGKNLFPTLAGSNNWTGCAIATGASTGIATGTISHTNGGDDSTGAHGLTSPTSRFSIFISSEATSGHDGWFWFHPDMTANNNIRLAQGGSEGQQSSKYYAAVTSSNAVVKSAAPTGTYRYIVFAENDLVSFYKYVNVSGTDSAYVHTNNKPHWMLWGQMTETGGGYGQYLAWSGTHNPYNPWTKCTRIHNISTNEITGSADILGAGFKVREASPGLGAWHQTDGQTTCGISIGTPFPLNNRAR